MKSFFMNAVSGLLFMAAACSVSEIICRIISKFTDIPEPIVHGTLALVMLALTAPLIVSLFSTDSLLRVAVLPPALAAAVSPMLIERAHHFAGFGFWEEPLPFQTLPLYGHLFVIFGGVVVLAALPTWRAMYLNR